MKPVEKIKKLLALSASSNEHEAKAALLKAQALMKEFNIEETELIAKDRSVLEKEFSFSFSKRRDPWMFSLCNTVADNFKCKAIFSRRDRTYTAKMAGFSEDADAALIILAYAYDCIQSNITALKQEYKSVYSNREIKQITDGYGVGFAKGLAIAFEKQKKEDESLALVLVTPMEVRDYIKQYNTMKTTSKALQSFDPYSFERGKADGEQFDPSTKIVGAEKALSA